MGSGVMVSSVADYFPFRSYFVFEKRASLLQSFCLALISVKLKSDANKDVQSFVFNGVKYGVQVLLKAISRGISTLCKIFNYKNFFSQKFYLSVAVSVDSENSSHSKFLDYVTFI